MNKVILMGRLTKEPEVRYTTNGNPTAVCRFTLAVDKKFQRQGEEKQADFIGCVAFGKTGEFVGKYFTKGRKMALVGSIQTRTWDDSEGKRHYSTDIIVDEVEFADSKKSEKTSGNHSDQDDSEGDGFYPIFDDDELPF